jgi:hypothetical protein
LISAAASLAVSCKPCKTTIAPSSRFGEMLAETQRDGDFGLFPTRETARAWLAR